MPAEVVGLHIEETVMIEIVDESEYDSSGNLVEVHQLYIDGGRKANVRKTNGRVVINWAVYGPQEWPEAKILLQGLLELFVLADSIAVKTK